MDGHFGQDAALHSFSGLSEPDCQLRVELMLTSTPTLTVHDKRDIMRVVSSIALDIGCVLKKYCHEEFA